MLIMKCETFVERVLAIYQNIASNILTNYKWISTLSGRRMALIC